MTEHERWRVVAILVAGPCNRELPALEDAIAALVGSDDEDGLLEVPLNGRRAGVRR